MSFLYYFIICWVIVAAWAGSDQDFKKKFIRQAIECSQEISITGVELQMLQKHSIPDAKTNKCFLACIMKKVKWIDNKGMFDESVAIKMTQAQHGDDKTKVDNAKKLYTICRNVNDKPVSDGEKGCERSAMLTKCLTENAPKFGFST